jgi:hypothetical protein
MAFVLRLSDAQQEALRARAAIECTSMQDIVRRAVGEYLERHSREGLIRMFAERTRADYSEAIRRLAE